MFLSIEKKPTLIKLILNTFSNKQNIYPKNTKFYDYKLQTMKSSQFRKRLNERAYVSTRRIT